MKNYMKSDPVFYEEITITEPTDPGHAENINAAPKQIFENTLVNKKEIEEGDSQNRTVTFTSGDTDTADKWKDVPKIVSGEKHKSLFEKVSTMFRNVRYLYNLLGSEDISQLGDGTVTGIVAALKQVAFLNPTNNLLATVAGTTLDAVQGSVLKNGQDDLQEQITQINSDLASANWLPRDGYDPLQENGLLHIYSVRPGLKPAQGLPEGYSEYGTIIAITKGEYNIILYCNVFGKVASYSTNGNKWIPYALDTLNNILNTTGISSLTGIPWGDVNCTGTNKGVTFFSNWTGETCFPENYGSGIILPCNDISSRKILYIGHSGKLYSGTFKANNKNNITWF